MSDKRIEMRLATAIHEAARPILEELDIDQLNALREAARGLSPTNCWFFTYQCRELLIRMADDEIHQLKTANIR